MKHAITMLLYFTVFSSCHGGVQINTIGGSNDKLDYLRNKIRKLEIELANKTEKLNKCAEKNKNFKIAGIATVGLAGAGVVTNVSLYSKMKNQATQWNNMAQEIAKTNQEWKDFLTEKNSLDIDWNKFRTAAEEEDLTIDEYNYLVEHNFFDGVSLSGLSESDRNLIQKVDRVLYKSKKE